MRVRVRRLVAISAIALVAMIGLALLAIHTAPVQRQVLAWSIAELERRFDLDLQADRLRYNLFSRRVTLVNVRLAAIGHRDNPFFTADHVGVLLPWTIFRGRLSFDEIAVGAGAVTITRDVDGVSNLPPGRGERPPDAPPRRLDVRALVVSHLDFVYHDYGRDVEIRGGHVQTDLEYVPGQGARGPFAIQDGMLIRIAERRVTSAPISAAMTFDGMNVAFEALEFRTEDGTVRTTGEIARVLDAPILDLALDITTDLARAERWIDPPVHLAGAAAIAGTMTGAPTEFVMDAQLTAARADIGRERGVRIDAAFRLTADGVAVSRSAIAPATGGTAAATLDLPFAEDAAWWIRADYQGIDAATAFRFGEIDPLPFGARFSGTLRLDSPAGPEPYRLEVRNLSTARDVPGTVPTSGTVNFTLRANTWRAVLQPHQLGATSASGTIGGGWNRQDVRRSTFSGTLDVSTADVADATRAAALFGLDTPDIVRDLSGPLTASVQLGGIFTSPEFSGRADSQALDVPVLGATAFTTAFTASERAFSVTGLQASVGAAQVAGDVRANLVTRQLDGSLTLDAPDAADLLTAVPEAFRLEGPVAATAILGGTVDEPDLVADVTGTGLMLAGQPVDTLDGRARLIDGGVAVESMRLTHGPGFITATGSYSWDAETFAADLRVEEWTWQGELGPLGDVGVQFSLNFSGAGPIDRPVGEGTLAFDLAGGTMLAALVDRGTATVRLDGDSALVNAAVPSVGAVLTATASPREPFAYDAVLAMERVDLAEVAPFAELPEDYVTGTISVNATAKGTLSEIAASQALINLHEIDALVGGVAVRLAGPSTLSWDGSALTVDALDLAVGRGRLLASGRLGEGPDTRWEARFDGELADLVTIAGPFGVPDELVAQGPVVGVWESTGGLDQSTGMVRILGGTVTYGEMPTVHNLTMQAVFDGATLEVTEITGRWQGGGIIGAASIPRALLEGQTGSAAPQTGFVRLQVVGLTEAAFAPWVDTATLANIDGLLSATFVAEITAASLDAVVGRITLDEADFTVAGVPVNQARPSVLTLRGGMLEVEDVEWTAGGAPLTLAGTVQLTPADQMALKLQLDGTVDLRLISAFAPTVAAEGTANIDAGIGGPPASPVFSGRVDLAGVEVAVREPRVLLSELSGTIALDGRRVIFDSLTGLLNGGALLLDGAFLLDGTDVTGGALTMQMQGAAFEYPAGLQSEANALLVLRPAATGFTLSGDVIVVRALYRRPITIADIIAARQEQPPVAPGADAAWRRELGLNIAIVTELDVLVDNNYGRLEAGAALNLVGTLADPGLLGRVTLREGGQVFLAGNTFYLDHGSVSFFNPNRIEPELDIELRTLVAGADLFLTLSGTLDRLETDVRSSDPTVSTQEAMAMLFGGFRGEDAIALLSGELLGVTGRAIGLDTLRLQRGFETDVFRADPGLIFEQTDPSARLTLSKHLRPNVELILSQSLRESGALSAIVSYKPRRNIEIRGISHDNRDRAVAIRHEITLGGPDAMRRDPALQPEITAVTISGEPGRPVEEIRQRLRQDPGDRFNFHTWQRDIDQVRDLYQDEGFYEVRVRGTRIEDEAANTVALDYRIEPGPLAELVVEGHRLDRGLQDDVREAWRQAIFDRFLLEDIESRINRHLLEENIIGSQVAADVALSTPGRKQVRITIVPGTQVGSREMRFTGNAAFTAGELNAVVRAAGLEVDGWIDPSRVAETLSNHYRGEGYLSVSVEADPPIVEANRGVLPVLIDEGPRFTLDVVEFPGVSPARIDDVHEAANLQPGMPYVTQQVADARRRVEDYYTRLGFNEVHVDPAIVADREDGTVDVVLSVTEGLQQILREVVTQGASRTDEAIIIRALRLRPGEAVNFQQWAQSRKRMYDTNVFQQVDIQPVPIDSTAEEEAAGIQPIRAVVTVVEYPNWRLRYGLQLNDERLETTDPDGDTRQQNLGLLGDIRNQNMFGRAVTGGLAGRYERDRQASNLFVSNSSFFGLPVRNSAFVFVSRQRFRFEGDVVSISDRIGLSAEQRWRPFVGSELVYSYRFDRNHAFDPSPSPFDPFPFDDVVRTSRLNLAFLVDRRDDPFEPTEGWFSSANWEQALRLLGSDHGAGRVLVQQLYFRTLGRLVLASRAQIGTGFGGEQLLFTQRFLAGGATSVRGYAENALGPRHALGFPEGGDALLIFNQEARFHVRGWIDGVAFADAGNVFRTSRDLSLGDLKVGYGVGLRLATPFVMLRADYGIPASPVLPDEPRRGRFYFGIGHIF